MKKIYFLIGLLVFCYFSSFAYHFSAICSTGQRLYYNVVDSTTVVLTYEEYYPTFTYDYYNPSLSSSNSELLVIPDSVYNPNTHLYCKVIGIGTRALSGCGHIGKLVIPNSVTTIGMQAFAKTDIDSLVIGKNVTSVSWSLFRDSYATSTSSGTWVNSNLRYCYLECTAGISLEDCPNLRTIYFNVKESYQGSFGNQTSLREIIIGENVKSLPNNIFSGCSFVTNWNLLCDSLISIGESAFANCTGLSGQIEFPNSLEFIGSNAFQNCSGLSGILRLPNQFKQISPGCFRGCSSLTGLILPDSLISYGDYSFCDCSNLTDTLNLQNVTYIGRSAFANCSNLQGVLTIPQTAQYIGASAFSNCDWILQLDMNGSAAIGDSAFMNCDRLVTVNINDHATAIGAHAFSNCPRLVNLNCTGNDVASIDGNAFYNCPWLVNVSLSNSITSIGDNAFAGAYRMLNTKLPASLTYIGSNAFKGCSSIAGSVTIPPYVSEIGQSAFEGDSAITALRMRPITPPVIYSNTFNDINPDIPVYVPCGCVLFYFVTNYWENFTDIKEDQPYDIFLSSNNEVMGDALVADPPTCSNHQAIIRAVANPGFHFLHWSDGNTTNPRVLNLAQDTTLRADFVVNNSWFTIHSCDTVKGTVSGSGMYTYNALAVLTATANSTYHFLRWSDGNTDNPRFIFATQDTTLTAVFVSNASNIAVGNFNPEMGTVSGSGLYYYMQQISIMASPNYGYHFYQWNDGNMQNPRPILVSNDTSFMAYFAPNIYAVAINANNSTMGTATGTGSYHYKMLVSFSASANYGYHFTQWNDGVTSNPRTLTVTQDTSFTAQFAANSYHVEVVPNDPLMGGAYGSGTYTYNTQTTISAMPTYGYHFVQWNDGNTENPRTISVTQNTQFEAQFEVNFYSISVSSNNPAIGSASGGGNYSYNSIINLVASPNYGYHFTQWSDGNTENPRAITVMQNATYTAQFAINSYPVSVSQNNASMGVVAGNGSYIYNTLATISATPLYGYHFTQWNDGNTENPRSVVVTQSMAFTAQFDYNTYDLSVLSNNITAGYTLGSGTYNYNSITSMTAVPAPHYHFDSWDDGAVENPRNILITQDSVFTALFYIDKHNVNVTSANLVMGNVSGSAMYDYGTNISFSAIPNYGYHFVRWNDGNTQNPRPLIVRTDASFEAQFGVNTYSATILSGDTAMGSVSNSGTYDYLTQVTLSATPKYGYHFVRWSDGVVSNPRTLTLTKDTVITAQFAINIYHVDVTTNNSNLGSVAGSGEYVYMSQAILSALANEHCHFEQWSDGSTSNPRQITVTNDFSLTAHFVEDEKFTVMVVSGNPEMGTTTGSGEYYVGMQALISAIPNNHYVFSQWSDGVTDNPRQLTVIENALFTALFVPEMYDIAAESNNNDMGVVTGGGTYAYGTVVTLTAMAHDGYHFVCWNDGDSSSVKTFIAENDVNYLAFFSEGVGIEEYANLDVKVYPNPTNGHLYIEADDVESVDILDIYGRLIVSVGNEHVVNLTELSSGVYVVRIKTRNGSIEKKVVRK